MSQPARNTLFKLSKYTACFQVLGSGLKEFADVIRGVVPALIQFRSNHRHDITLHKEKMDRTAWIVITLATIGLIGSIYWQQEQATAARARYQQQRALTAQATPTVQTTPAPVVSSASVAEPEQQRTTPDLPEKFETLKSNVALLTVSSNRGGLSKVDLLNHAAEHGQKVQLNTPLAPGIGAITVDPKAWDDSGYNLSLDQDAGTATMSRRWNDQMEITKTFSIAQKAGLKDDYQVKFSITFRNSGSDQLQAPGFFVSTGAAEQIHRTDRTIATQFDWYRDGKATTIDVNWFDPAVLFWAIQTRPANEVYYAPPAGQAPDRIVWAGVSNQYFATILVPTNITGERVWARRLQIPATDNLSALRGIYGALLLPHFDLAPGQSKTFDFNIYAGPKEYSRLAKISNDQTEVMGFTPWTKWISVLLLTVLNTLHSWVHSYALAIIIMTILIRGLLWPLQNAATKSMRRMAKLSPIVNELREKYKDDPQRINQEMMKLYKEYGINPVGGCLPMLIQIPIFFGFYGMLDKAIELRNSSFLWVHDLSQPDTVFHLGSIPINILPLIMAGTQVWQMSITPKTGDPAQQRLFLFMPLIFLFICYNYASALSLYWTVQNLFIIVQIYLTRNQMDAPLKKTRLTPVVAKKKSYR